MVDSMRGTLRNGFEEAGPRRSREDGGRHSGHAAADEAACRLDVSIGGAIAPGGSQRVEHADAEYHHLTHASWSRHPGHHHLLTVEGLTVAFERYGARGGRGCALELTDPESAGIAPFSGLSLRVRGDVLHGLSLSVHTGEVVAVVGASGSGKTVLADALLGLYEPNAIVEGRIWFDGTRLDADSLGALRGRGISLVPQSVSYLDPLMCVGRQVQGAPHGRTRSERAVDRMRREVRQRELFRAYGLSPDVERMYPHELSGGMVRRVLLMCALMEEPRVLIADEPTPGLDVELAVHAVDDLRAFADTGAGVILITHDLELAVRVADRVAVFKGGRIVEETAARSFADPALLEHEFSRALCRELMALQHDSSKGSFDDGARRPGDACRLSDVGDALLEARSLSFAYGASPAVIVDFDLSVRAGERIALVGPSGAGKTTLCKLLAGYLQPSSGAVRVADRDRLGARAAEDRLGARAVRDARVARPVQLISQHPEGAFDPRMLMRDSLAEAGKVDGAVARDLMARFGVQEGWLDRLPHELSGGELMRCCLVRALMTRPIILICDESTAMLDLVTQAELWRVILDLQERDAFGLIFVSHNPALVNRLATRTVPIG